MCQIKNLNNEVSIGSFLIFLKSFFNYNIFVIH